MNAVCGGQLFQWLIFPAPQPMVPFPTNNSGRATGETNDPACVPMVQVETIQETLCINPETIFTIHELDERGEWREWYQQVVELSRLLFNLVEGRIQELEGAEMEIDGDVDDDEVRALRWLSIS